MLRPFLGPRISSSERQQQVCVFGSSSSEPLLFGVTAGRYMLDVLRVGTGSGVHPALEVGEG
eukprot:3676927-Alexandrium_andersonii.AAC.1